MSDLKRLSLPRPTAATLRSFSLYDHAPEVRAEFGDGVFCLAGANGLGKSTFLAAIGFALTGTVPEPGKEFSSAEEYLKDLRAYSRTVFEGRISEFDRDVAEIDLEMSVGSRRYEITRNMFEPTGLRRLQVWNEAGELAIDTTGDDDLSPGEIQEQFEEAIVADVGIPTFAQLVMLHHLVFTFDERRHLLFWDDKVSQAALFLTFGLDPDDARRAETLRRNAERADSRARNHQYAATTARKNMEELAKKLADSEDSASPDVVEQALALQKAHKHAESEVMAALDRHRDAEFRRTNASASLREAREEYEREFSRVLFGRKDPAAHPIVQGLMATGSCALCGSKHEHATLHAEALLSEGKCPLCLDDITVETTDTSDLDALDVAVRSAEAALASEAVAVPRLLSDLEVAQKELRELRDRLNEIEDAEIRALVRQPTGENQLDQVLDAYRADIADRIERKTIERAKRDEYRKELRVLQDRLAIGYNAAETSFVPEFSRLAQAFLGLDLQLSLEINQDITRLVLEVEGTNRRGAVSLSESQRFFVDIALRMALALHLSDPGEAPTLYVDTPEGSLDIAYERRAGAMFGEFVKSNAHMVMTANINSSELLLRLAETCGRDLMRLQRMTEWATLSDVQESEHDAFDRAFNEIESRLGPAE